MQVAIVDIGSNAIRSCIYRDRTLGSPVIFYQTFKCNIRSLLDQEIMDIDHDVFRCFQYFVKVFDNHAVKDIKCVATAVLRNHHQSQAFVATVKQKFGLCIQILSGEEEASFTAQGLIQTISEVNGLAADMGGGSLELMEIAGHDIKKTLSIPLESKLENDDKIDEILDIISNSFKNYSCKNLYLMGGAFRAIGCDWIHRNQHNIKVLHNLSIPVSSFYEYTNLIDNNTSNIAYHNAIKIITAMLKSTSAENIILSSYGLKEGVRFHYYMNPEELKKDIIFERVSRITGFNDTNCDLEKLYSVIAEISGFNDKLFKDAIFFAIMFTNLYNKAGCIAGSNFVTDFVLCADIPFTAQQRIMLVNVLATIYHNKIPYHITTLSKMYLNYGDYLKSHIIGNYIRILLEIDGKQISTPTFDLRMDSNEFIDIITEYTLPDAIYYRTKGSLSRISSYIWKSSTKV